MGVGELAETGVDAVGRLVRGDDARHHFGRRVDVAPAGGIELEGNVSARDGAQVGERKLGGGEAHEYLAGG